MAWLNNLDRRETRLFTTALVLLSIGMAIAFVMGRTEAKKPKPSPDHIGKWNLPGKPPHLVAHYMPWFEVEANPNSDQSIFSRLLSSWVGDRQFRSDPERSWRHWKWEQGGPVRDPGERRPDGLRKISSINYPLIGPYNSRSRNAVRYHLATAKAAGIQAFLVIWYGPGSYEDQQVPLLLDEAARQGMKIAICYEEKLNFPGFRDLKSREEVVDYVADDLNYIIDRYTSHPAYLRRDGLPFIYQFNGWGEGPLGPHRVMPVEWKEVFDRLDVPIFFARQNLDEDYYPPIDGGYTWWTKDTRWLKRAPARAAELKRQGRLDFFMTMICPGFDDTGVWGWGEGPRKVERHGVSTLRQTFDMAFIGNPELVQIVTWNDFAEGTMVEPTRENGFWYLDAIERWWGDRTGRPVNLADNRQPFLEYVQSCSDIESAELPKPPYDPYLQIKSLDIDVPNPMDLPN